MENQYLTKKVVHKSLILFAVLIAIEIALSLIIPSYLNFYFCAIAFLLVVIPVFYNQLGIKKTIVYSVLWLIIFTVFNFLVNYATFILYSLIMPREYDIINILGLVGILLAKLALFLAMLVSFKIITKSTNIKIKCNFFTFVILVVYLILYSVASNIGGRIVSIISFNRLFSSNILLLSLPSYKLMYILENCLNILTSLFIFITSLQLIKSAVIKEE